MTIRISNLTIAAALLVSGAALAQAPGAQKAQKPAAAQKSQAAPAQKQPPAPPALQQIALTERHIDGVIAAQKDMDAVTEKMGEGAKPNPKLMQQAEDVARKNGFASFAEYNAVVENIGLVLAGFDAKTKAYVGQEAVLKAELAAIEADKSIPAKDKKQAVADLTAALKAPAPEIANKGNIEVVTRHYDRLAALFQDGE